MRALLVAALLYGSGAFWPVLQLTAWATMEKDQAPCGLCLTVEKGVAGSAVLDAVAVDFAAPHALVVAVDLPSEPVLVVLHAHERDASRPDSPPPRTLPA